MVPPGPPTRDADAVALSAVVMALGTDGPAPTAARATAPGVGAARRLRRCLAGLELPPWSSTAPTVTDADLDPLPVAAQRYLRAMDVVGWPRTRSFRVRFSGRFRRGPDQPWMPCTAWQYSCGPVPARAYAMRVDMAGVLPMYGTDTYAGGHGRMRGRLLGLVPVADGSGPELDLGELTTWVDDAVLLAPSMLLGPAATWRGVDDATFDVTVRDAGLTSTARVTLDADGRPADVVSEDRWADLPGGRVRAAWHTPVERWERHAGGWFPGPGRAVWALPDGDLEYARGRFDPSTFVADLPPGRAAQGARQADRRAAPPGRP